MNRRVVLAALTLSFAARAEPAQLWRTVAMPPAVGERDIAKAVSGRSMAGIVMGNAPLGAIGKLTEKDDPKAPAVCTAVLIHPTVILTATACRSGEGARYFFALSASEDSDYEGGVEIERFSSDLGGGVMLGTLAYDLVLRDADPTTAYFGVREMNTPMPPMWMNRKFWAMAGYAMEEEGSPTIETGCAMIHQAGRVVYHDCSDRFLPGTPMFANLCGVWELVAIKTVATVRRLTPSSTFMGGLRSQLYLTSVSASEFFRAAGSCEVPASVPPSSLLPVQLLPPPMRFE